MHVVSHAAGLRDVAQEAGVSITTVSNVINRPEVVSEFTRQRVQSVIRMLGYVPNESARQLRAGQSRTLGLMLLDMGNPFFIEMARGAEESARKMGYAVMVCGSGQDSSVEAHYLALFAEMRVHGVLISSADSLGCNLEILKRSNIPFVRVDQAGPDIDACSASVDDIAGGHAAMRHLLEMGHRVIAYAGGPSHLRQIQDRRLGALKAIKEAGLPAHTLRDIQIEGTDVAAGRDVGARILGLGKRPTAIFCANDLMALGLLQILFAAGIAIPDDISIVGYDDIDFAAAAAVPITSVRQPAASLGARAAQLLFQETEELSDSHVHEHVVLQPSLVVRKSSTVTGARRT